MQQKLGVTFVIVTHDQEEAMTMADRIGVMDRGRLVQVATPPEIYEQPNSRWVAGFIGDVNLIEGRVVACGADATAIEAAAGGRLSVAPVAGLKAGDDSLRRAAAGEDRASGRRRRTRAATIASPARSSTSAISATSRSTRCVLDNGLVMRAAAANMARLTQRPIGWDDRVTLSFAPQAAIVLTRVRRG